MGIALITIDIVMLCELTAPILRRSTTTKTTKEDDTQSEYANEICGRERKIAK